MKHLVSFFALLALSMHAFGQEKSTEATAVRTPLPTKNQLVKLRPMRTLSTTATSFPLEMSYQGALTNPSGFPVGDGSYDLTVTLFDSLTNGTSQWTETHAGVQVSHGAFSIVLGETTPLTLQFNKPLFVQIVVTAGPTGHPYPITLSPRSQLLSSPYSLAPWVTNGSDVYYKTGPVGIGSAMPESSKVSTSLRLEIADETGAQSDVAVRAAGGGYPVLNLATSRGSLSSPAATLFDDFDGSIQFLGYDGTQFAHGAGIYAWVSGSPVAGKIPTNLTFGTTDSAHGFVERMALDRGGTLFIDSWQFNTGGLRPGLAFGNWLATGEGISSTRSVGPNLFGLDLYTNNIPRISVTNGGNVGIGTATPTERLNVAGSMQLGNNVFPYVHLGLSGGNSNGFVYGDYNKYPDAINIGYNYTTDGAGGNVIPNSGGPTSRISLYYGAIGMFVGGVNTEPNILGLWVDGLGNVGIGTSTPSARLCVSGNISYSGVVAGCSDIRYKRDITPLSSSLQKVASLRGVNYYWRTDEFPEQKFSPDKQIGLIAQEVEKVYPEVVVTDKNGYKSIDYARLTPPLIEAMKELKSQNEALEHRVRDLESSLKQLLSERRNASNRSLGELK